VARDRKRNKRRPARTAPAHDEPGMPDVEPAVPEAVGPPVVPGPVNLEAESDDQELAAPSAAPAVRAKPSGNRVAAFMRASWAELQRVQWPDRRQVGQATAVVLGFVVIAGSFLGLADLLASNLVDAFL